MTISHILETALYATDLEQAEVFYTNVLGLKLFASEPGRHLFFKLGRQMLLIFNADRTLKETEVAPHGARGPGHIAFEVALDEMHFWENRLRQSGITIEKDMSWPKGGSSLYFRDPAGNSLEFASPLLWGMQERYDV